MKKMEQLKGRKLFGLVLSLVLIASLVLPAVAYAVGHDNPEKQDQKRSKPAEEGDTKVLALMHEINEQLATQGMNIAVEEIEFFTIGKERPTTRIHQQPFRWVAKDLRRDAQGDDITYLVDQSDGATASGLTKEDTEGAIDSAMETWDTGKSLKKVDLEKRTDSGADPDIFDCLVEPIDGTYGDFGDPFLADITHAGWLPKGFFDAVGGSDGGYHILGFSVTFIFVDGNEKPTDINGDNYLDTALNEVYYNDNFGDPDGTCPDNPWDIDEELPGIDVETVALHESGHSLCVGHFGPPPKAVMNPVYAGIRQSPFPVDHASMCTVWGSWPK
jgi:hypothetical protein